jgi:hypothetical protein
MGVAVSFTGYTPPARYDAVPWTDAQIEESATEDGSYTIIDTVSLGTPDVDPSDPAARSFTTVLGTDNDLWYRVVFLDAALTTSEPTSPVQNSFSAIVDADPYATADELARILKIRTPSADQTTAMERVLAAAAGEINSEIGRTNSDLSGWELSLAQEVNLERAVEHWRQEESPFGLIGLGAETGPAFTSKDSWERHALKLAPLKGSGGSPRARSPRSSTRWPTPIRDVLDDVTTSTSRSSRGWC